MSGTDSLSRFLSATQPNRTLAPEELGDNVGLLCIVADIWERLDVEAAMAVAPFSRDIFGHLRQTCEIAGLLILLKSLPPPNTLCRPAGHNDKSPRTGN